MNMKKWNRDDKSDKQFVNVVKDNGCGGFTPVPIQSLIIGEPCLLLLPDGTVVKTSPVMEWTIYGHTEIRTRSRSYYPV